MFGLRWVGMNPAALAPNAMSSAMNSVMTSAMGNALNPGAGLGEVLNRLTAQPMGMAMPPIASGASPAAPPKRAEAASQRAEREALKLSMTARGGVAAPAKGAPGSAEPSAENTAADTSQKLNGAAKVSAATPQAGEEGPIAPEHLFSAPPEAPDDLTKIYGIGPRLQQLLNELGVYHFEQIASFTRAELAWLDEQLFVIKGRAERDRWVESAKRAMADAAED